MKTGVLNAYKAININYSYLYVVFYYKILSNLNKSTQNTRK